MTPNAFGWAAVLIARKLLKATPSLTWDELQTWIADMSSPDSFGRRYGQQKFQARRPDGRVEVRREKLRGDQFRISAALIIGPRNQIVATKTWDVEKIDGALVKKFGDGLRFTVNV